MSKWFICIVIIIIIGGRYGYLDKPLCWFKDECCNSNSIPGNIKQLTKLLRDHVFGQDIAINLVTNAIYIHWNTPHAEKPLTISFHGVTGSGKTYMSRFIAESLYTKGIKSKYVSVISSTQYPEESQLSEYKKQLYNLIKEKVTECEKQLFIFDDIDRMNAGFIDGLKTILDTYDIIDGVDYRQTIFIFLSNHGSKSLTKQYLNLSGSGLLRKNMKADDFEALLAQESFNLNGGFYHSDIIKRSLIDYYVPFLPMEREHVEKCIRREFYIRNVGYPDDEDIEEVMASMEWTPKLLGKTGCKRVGTKVAQIVMQKYKDWNDEL